MTKNPEIVYTINSDDVIDFVNPEWVSFAMLNGAPAIADGVVGTSLWSHIAGEEVAHLYRRMIERVGEGRVIRFPFRCDAPDRRRFLRMAMTSLPNSGVAFHCELLREEPRAAVSSLLMRVGGVTSDLSPLHVCAWCKRIRDGGEWFEIEEAVQRLGLFDEATMPPLTHGICPACAAVLEPGEA